MSQLQTQTLPPVKAFNYAKQYKCIADKCEAICCYSNWRVAINDEMAEVYKEQAPDVYETLQFDERGAKMILVGEGKDRRCVNVEDGLCSIQVKYGEDLVPDTCYFYPRNFRYVGDTMMISATTSCVEVARLTLFGDDPFSIVDGHENRIKPGMPDVKPEGTSKEDCWNVMARFLAETEREDIDAEAIMMRILLVSKMLDDYDINSWHVVVDSLFALADFQHIPPSDTPFGQFDLLLHLSELESSGSSYFANAYREAQKIFNVQINRSTNLPEIHLNQFIKDSYLHGNSKEYLNKVMKRFIGSELSRILFPYAWNDSDNPFEKAAVIAMNFGQIRLCIMGKIDQNGNPPDEADIVRSVYGIFRSQNHLTQNKVDYFREKGLLNMGSLFQVIFL